jgi:hypothetical protein
MDIWAEGLLAGRCAAAVPVQVPLRCQQATGVGAVGVAGVQGLTEAHYGLTTAYVAFRRAAGGAGWGGSGRASGGAGSGQAMRSNVQRAGWASGSVDGREGSSGVVSLLCVREEGKVPVPVPGRSAELRAHGHRFVPRARARPPTSLGATTTQSSALAQGASLSRSSH